MCCPLSRSQAIAANVGGHREDPYPLIPSLPPTPAAVWAHLATAITMAMIEQDQACRFCPATALLQVLHKAKASNELPAP